MSRDLLKRDLAPITPDALAAVDAEATRVLKLNLAGRRLVDFKGPHGWQLAAVNTGRLDPCAGGGADRPCSSAFDGRSRSWRCACR